MVLLRTLLLIVAVTVLSPRVLVAAQDSPSGNALMAEALEYFKALDYEQAVPALDKAIAALEPRASSSEADRVGLVDAFAMRARARFGLNDVEGATADLRSVLLLEPDFTFDPTISPRVVTLLDSVRKTTVGGLRVTVDPADAAVAIAGQPVKLSSEPISIAAGEVAVSVTRVGFRPLEQSVTISAGAVRDLAVTLERTAAAVYFVTSPPGTEVVIDGIPRGRTVAGPLPSEYATAPARLGVSADDVSAPLILSDLAAGRHTVAFRGDCRIPEERPLVIEQLADYRVEPVLLRRAVAPLSVASLPSGATVYLDGREAGTTPGNLPDVCEGAHKIDVRSRFGRYSRTVTVTAGQPVAVEGVLAPAFALVPSGEPTAPGLPDPRTRVERSLAGVEAVSLYVPTEAELEAATAGQPLPNDWLAFDANRRPIGGAAALTAAGRRDLSERLSKGLGVQGIAAVTQPSSSSSELVVALLAAGSGQPDVLPLLPEDAASANNATEQLGYKPRLFRQHLGAVVIEVLDGASTRLVVATVQPDGPAARAGLAPGERIVKAAGKVVDSASVLEELIDVHDRSSQLTLDVVGRTGTVRTVAVNLVNTPRVVSVFDQTLLFNALAIGLRSQLAAAEPSLAPIVRLNLGVALIRVGDYRSAVDELKMLELAPGAGISRGTQQYLLGVAYEGLGELVSARQAWQEAAAAGGTLTEDGPPVADLVARKMEPPGSGQP